MPMLVYGVCIGPSETYDRVCKPSLPEGSVVLERHQQSSIFVAYNAILDDFMGLVGAEALVLLHDDVEIRPAFERQVRAALDSGASIIGAIGSLHPRSIAWWEGDQRGCVVEPYRRFDYGGGLHEVDTIDGLIMVLSHRCASIGYLLGATHLRPHEIP